MTQRFKLRAASLMALIVAVASPLLATTPVSAWSSCSGYVGYGTVCVDPTTGYGPVVYIYNSSGTLVWTSGVNSIDVKGTVLVSPKVVDQGDFVRYGWDGYYVNFSVGPAWPGGNYGHDSISLTMMNQSTMDSFRWVSNYYNTQVARTVW